jgi:hypothetical protein
LSIDWEGGVDFGEGGSVRLSTPPPVNEQDIDYRVPNVMQITDDGSAVPVNYELKDGDGDGDATSSAPPSLEEVP